MCSNAPSVSSCGAPSRPMPRRSRLRTEKRLEALEGMAGSFQPAEPMRELTREEVGEVLEVLFGAMGEEEFGERFGEVFQLDSDFRESSDAGATLPALRTNALASD